eukprot:scaffold300591_cov40-Prasinocladus_malaysianus.AAC.2
MANKIAASPVRQLVDFPCNHMEEFHSAYIFFNMQIDRAWLNPTDLGMSKLLRRALAPAVLYVVDSIAGS